MSGAQAKKDFHVVWPPPRVVCVWRLGKDGRWLREDAKVDGFLLPTFLLSSLLFPFIFSTLDSGLSKIPLSCRSGFVRVEVAV